MEQPMKANNNKWRHKTIKLIFQGPLSQKISFLCKEKVAYILYPANTQTNGDTENRELLFQDLRVRLFYL